MKIFWNDKNKFLSKKWTINHTFYPRIYIHRGEWYSYLYNYLYKKTILLDDVTISHSHIARLALGEALSYAKTGGHYNKVTP